MIQIITRQIVRMLGTVVMIIMMITSIATKFITMSWWHHDRHHHCYSWLSVIADHGYNEQETDCANAWHCCHLLFCLPSPLQGHLSLITKQFGVQKLPLGWGGGGFIVQEVSPEKNIYWIEKQADWFNLKSTCLIYLSRYWLYGWLYRLMRFMSI